MALTIIAETGADLVDFAPYVPSIDDAGTVTFTARTADGGSGVFRVGQLGLEPMMRFTADAAIVASHPAHVGDAVSFYAGGAVILGGERVGAPEWTAGPLGPTINRHGMVALRATVSGSGLVAIADKGSARVIARCGSDIAAFDGLPVIGDDGHVVFRCTDVSGGQSIRVATRRGTDVVVATGARFSELGRFPSINQRGAIAFSAVETSGESGAFICADSGARCLVSAASGFESFRGALVDERGDVVFYATPSGGALTVYRLRSQGHEPVLAFGQPLAGSFVEDLALNPVSINAAGALAIRVALGDGRQLIVVDTPPE